MTVQEVTPKTWKATINGQTFYRSDLTLGDQIDVAAWVGEPNRWLASHPFTGPRNTVAVMAVFLRRIDPTLTWDEAIEKARGWSQDAPVFEVVDEDDGPTEFENGIPVPSR